MMHYHTFIPFCKQNEREGRVRSYECENTQRENARHHHVVGIGAGPSEAFSCCLQITSISTLKVVGTLLASLRKENTLEWNWTLAQYTFNVTRVPDIIACLQAHVYISNDDILHYSTLLKRLNDEELEAVSAMAEEDAENEADGNSSEDWDDDLEMEEMRTKQCIPGSVDGHLHLVHSDDLKPADTMTSSPKVTASSMPGEKQKRTKCNEMDCDTNVYKKSKCWRHGVGKQICSELGCDKKVVSRFGGKKCFSHGDKKLCGESPSSMPGEKQKKTKCNEMDCDTNVYKKSKCWRHGQGKQICNELRCEKIAYTSGKCRAHGGGTKRCSEFDCVNLSVIKKGKCTRHGPTGPTCSTQECKFAAKIDGKCKKHYEAELHPRQTYQLQRRMFRN